LAKCFSPVNKPIDVGKFAHTCTHTLHLPPRRGKSGPPLTIVSPSLPHVQIICTKKLLLLLQKALDDDWYTK
jgi:hypothetical protein